MEKHVISLGMQNKMMHIIFGMCYMTLGIVEIMEILCMQIPYSEVIKSILLLTATVCVIACVFAKGEQHDEMSRAYLNEAGLFGFRCVVLAAYFFLMLDIFFKGAVTLRAAVPTIAGIGFLALGIKFYRLEKDGDE